MTDQIIPADLLTRGKVLTGLRQLADWLEAHPDVPVAPFGWDLNVYTDRNGGSDDAARAEVDQIAAALGVPVTDDTGSDGHYKAFRTFGLITYQAVHVPARRMAAHYALMSYSGSVAPAVTP